MIDKLLLDRWIGDAQAEEYIAWAVDLLVGGRDTPTTEKMCGRSPSRGDRKVANRRRMRSIHSSS